MIKGGETMNYDALLKTIADKYNTTPEDVDKNIKQAIELSGHNITPELFINLCAEKVKKTINRNQYIL